MTNTAFKIGERFSLAYQPADSTASDSERFRRRLSAFLIELAWSYRHDISGALTRELGAAVPGYWDTHKNYHPNFKEFYEKASLRDVLDSITVIYRVLKDQLSREASARAWRDFVERALREEGMQYKVDYSGGIRFLVDELFEKTRTGCIASLTALGMLSVASLVEQAFEHLASIRPDSKLAIRTIFEAMETFCKKQFETGEDLTERLIAKTIAPWITSFYVSQDDVVKASGDRLIQGLKAVVNTAHIYRHGQNTDKLLQPPSELATAVVSQAADYLRWLSQIAGARRAGTQVNKPIDPNSL